jgi:murein DD-endopeptidase MepM/ murein hydrolase activator NlpD
MDIIDSINMARKTRTRMEAAAVLSASVPLTRLNLLLSVKEAITNSRHIHERQLLNQVSTKLLGAAQGLVNRDRESRVHLDDDEKSVLDAVGDGLMTGARVVIGAVARGVTMVLGTLFRYVIAPTFRLLGAAVLRLLPMLFSPAGLAVMGVGLVGWGAYEFYKRFKDNAPSGAEEGAPVPMPAAGAAPTPIPNVPIPKLSAPEVKTLSQLPKLGVAESKLEEDPKKKLPLGIRNNNPGNLRYAGQPGADPSSGAFAVFPTQGLGLFNLARQIGLHYYKRRLNTVGKLIPVWAPPNENNTGAYVASVAKQIGLKSDQQFDFQDLATVKALMIAIIIHENGYNPYSDAQITEAAKAAMDLLKDNEMVMPASGIISSMYGKRVAPVEGASESHAGIDIAGPEGSEIQAAQSGTVVRAGTLTGYGNVIDVKGGTFYTRYGHLSKFSVKKGDVVNAGQKIGEMGSTGVSSGSHLHFEIRTINADGTAGGAIDPAPYLGVKGKGNKLAMGQRPVVLAATTDKPELVKGKDGKLVRVKT